MKGLSRLAQAYLEELGLLERLNGEETPEKIAWVERAGQAEEKVEAAFAELKAQGQLRDLSVTYRAKRHEASQKGQKLAPWPVFVMDEKVRMIRAMAQEQKTRARRGIKP